MDMAWYGMYVKIYGISDDINVPKSNLGDRPRGDGLESTQVMLTWRFRLVLFFFLYTDRLNPEGHANLK